MILKAHILGARRGHCVTATKGTPGGGTRPARGMSQAERETICGACPWNVDWICEHPGCKPCRQRKLGGLRIALDVPGFRCAAGKWH